MRVMRALAAVGLAGFEHDGVVLVGGEQAFAASGRAHDEHGVTARGLAPAIGGHARLGQFAGAAGGGAEFGADHVGDAARFDLLGVE